MKKLMFIVALGSVLTVSGCGSTGKGGSSISNLNFSEMSCEDINQTFSSYQRKKNTAKGLTSLASTLGLNKGGIATQATVASDSIYFNATKIARPIAVSKGCTVTF
jgi:hypothetical protein